MNFYNIVEELNNMITIIKADALRWHHAWHRGGNHMKRYSTLCAKIFEKEARYEKTNSQRKQQKIQRRILRNFKQVDKIRQRLQETLQLLKIIQWRTEIMYQRIRLWNEDDLVREHCIICDLTTNKLLELLEFLTQRYAYEWEIKEMVLLELKNVSNNYDVQILLQSWLNNSHAGGPEFEGKLLEFLKCVDESEVISLEHSKCT